MKIFKRSMLAVLALGLVLFGCQPDNVDPAGAKGGKSVAGAFDATHTALDSICLSTSPVYFRNGAGSFDVDKCIGAGGVLVTCNGPQMKWGSLTMYSGYTGLNLPVPAPEHWVDVDFSLSTGWMCDFTNWAFVVTNGITIDPNTGLPVMTGQDWKSQAVNPARNQWKIAIPVDSLPTGSFDMACRMTVLRLKLNGSPNEPTRTTLWMVNENYANTGSPFASNNEYSLHYTPVGCIAPPPPACPTTVTNAVCEAVYKGITCTGNTMNTTTLTADSAGAGATATYLWSNGATTRSITVTPAATTAYTVTVKKGNCDIRVSTFNVNVIDASCVIGGGSNGGGNTGGGNTGGGAPNCGNNHHNNNHSGCSHNSSNPANCGTNHRYGNHSTCSHTGNTPNCGTNHRYGNHSGCSHNSSNPANCGNNHHNNNHSGCTHTPSNNNNGSGSGSGNNNGGGCGGNGGGNNGGGNGTPGVKVCHVPPGNPSGATTVCVSVNQLSQHVTGVCGASNGGGGNGGGGNGGNCGGNGGSGSGSGSGSGNNSHAPNCGNNHHQGNHSGCTHNSSNPANCGNNHRYGNHSGCTHSNGNGNGNGGSGSGSGQGGHCSHSGGNSGCGNGNPSGGHSGDKIGACNSNPCQ